MGISLVGIQPLFNGERPLIPWSLAGLRACVACAWVAAKVCRHDSCTTAESWEDFGLGGGWVWRTDRWRSGGFCFVFSKKLLRVDERLMKGYFFACDWEGGGVRSMNSWYYTCFFILRTFVQCKWQIWMVPTRHLPNHHSRTNKKQQNQQQLSKTTGIYGEMNRQPTDLQKSTVKYVDSSRESSTKREWYVSFSMRSQKMFGSWMCLERICGKTYFARKTFAVSSHNFLWKFSFVSFFFLLNFSTYSPRVPPTSNNYLSSH